MSSHHKVMQYIKNIINTIGTVPSIIIGVLLLVMLWFAIGGIFSSIDSYRYQREIDRLTNEADALRTEAQTYQKQKDEAVGAAAAYKAQADAVQNELTELLNVRPDLQNKVNAAITKTNQIRNSPTIPVSGDMRERVNKLSADLERLYPDPDGN